MGAALFFWIVFSVLIGALASSWGRNGLGYFAGSLVISPLLAVLVLLAQGRANADSTDTTTGSSSGRSVPFENQRKKCPDCAERVKLEARVCKHCGHEWTEKEVKGGLRAAVEQRSETLVHCSRVDKIVSPEGVMCPECGSEFDDEDHTPAREYFQI